MNLLLDTHTLLWVFSRDPRLSGEATDAIRDGSTVVYASAVTAWEISIKKALGKLEAPANYLEGLRLYRFTPLAISTEHALAVEALQPHHRDPFDRMLVAQALEEKLVLVTHDTHLRAYGVPILET
ncbi:MAG: type II toxin-antitoxin system VapC family toxin [Trueperaceae bacterium]